MQPVTFLKILQGVYHGKYLMLTIFQGHEIMYYCFIKTSTYFEIFNELHF